MFKIHMRLISMFNEFISTVYHLVINGRWTELQQYFNLIKDILSAPHAEIIPGIPQNKG